MKTLILSSSTGAGHDSCANAIKEVFDKNQEYCTVAEVLNFISKGVANIITNGHTTMYRYFPKVFKFGYEFLENHASFYGKGTLTNNFLCLGAKKLGEYIKSESYDTVICTHPFSTIVLTAAVELYDLKIKTAFVATDYTCAPTVNAKSLDLYFVPDNALTDTFIKYGIEKSKIIPSGIPVRQMFYNNADKHNAKTHFCANPNSTHLLIMCGSMGCGPIKKLVKDISLDLPENTEITIVCGTNKRLETRLKKKYYGNPALHIHGFVKDMSFLLDSADLYLTKPGGLSVSEARQKGLPMVFINAVAGCEEHNKQHFVNMGAAICDNSNQQLAQKCITLLKNSEKIAEMSNLLKKEEKTNASEFIREYLID